MKAALADYDISWHTRVTTKLFIIFLLFFVCFIFKKNLESVLTQRAISLLENL